MAERMDYIQMPDVINQRMRILRMLCTDNFIIVCSFGSRCFFEYSFMKKEWNILLYNGVPRDLLYFKTMILKQQHLVVHGMLHSEIKDGILRTYKGDISERPIRFRLIGTLEFRELNGQINFFSNNDDLYSSIMTREEMNGSRQLITFRLDAANNWTEVFRSVRDINGKMETMIVYNGILYIFPTGSSNSIDFKRLIAFDLRTGHHSMVDLLPADGPPPVFPFMFNFIIQNISLAQCPAEPWHMYLILSNDLFDSLWEVWRLDMNAMQWHMGPRYEVRPEGLEITEKTSVITSFGRLFVLSSTFCSSRRQVPNRLFSMWVRMPQLENRCLNAALENLHVVDPEKDSSIPPDGTS